MEKKRLPHSWENGPMLNIADAQISIQGAYDCVVSNVGGVVISAAAVLIVNDLSKFEQTAPAEPPPTNGFVLVNVDPPISGSGWRFVGEQEWRLPGVPAVGLTTSDRTVEFRPVPGYLHPPSELVGVVSGGAASVLSRSYYVTPSEGNGSLSITIKPDSVADPNGTVLSGISVF